MATKTKKRGENTPRFLLDGFGLRPANEMSCPAIG
jgi:hypothetical protein